MLWTPAVLVFGPGGRERFRIEGYLPNGEFRAHLQLALARVAFMDKKWAEAEAVYAGVRRDYPDTIAAAEAQYWTGVAQYKSMKDHTALERTAREFQNRYQGSIWAKKASVWRS